MAALTRAGRRATLAALALVGCEDFRQGDPRGDAGCADGVAARLIAPLAGARVAGARVRLRWELPVEADGAEVVYCDRRDCTSGEAHPRQRVTGREVLSAYVPSGVRPVYWRVVPLRGGGRCGAPSATWWYAPEAGSGAREGAAWRSVADVNADGVADFIASGHTANRTYQFLGGTSGLASVPRVLERAGGMRFGAGLVVGDLNGDGLPELNVEEGGAESNHTLWVYYGASGGLGASPAELPGPQPNSQQHAVGISDLDGDGYGDLVTSADGNNAASDEPGHIYVHRGRPGVSPAERSLLVEGPRVAGLRFGAFTAVADANDDGRDDLFVSAFDGSEYHVYVNAAGRFTDEPVVVRALGGQAFGPGTRVYPAGDLDGDGRLDAVFHRREGYVIAAYGAERGRRPDFSRVTVLRPEPAEMTRFAQSVVAGDFTGDGLTDLVIGNIRPDFSTVVQLFPGDPRGLAARAAQSFDVADGFFGSATAGDYNADGALDVAVGEPDWRSGAGRCFWLSGHPGAGRWLVLRAYLTHGDGAARMGFSVW